MYQRKYTASDNTFNYFVQGYNEKLKQPNIDVNNLNQQFFDQLIIYLDNEQNNDSTKLDAILDFFYTYRTVNIESRTSAIPALYKKLDFMRILSD